METQISTWKGLAWMLTHPMKGFAALYTIARERHLVIILLCIAATTAINNMDLLARDALPVIWAIVYVAFIFIMTWAFLIVYTAIVNRLNRISGVSMDTAKLSNMFAFALIPQVVINCIEFGVVSLYNSPIPTGPIQINQVLPVIASMWTIALLAIANSAVTRLPLAKSIMATLIPVLLFYTTIRFMLYVANIA